MYGCLLLPFMLFGVDLLRRDAINAIFHSSTYWWHKSNFVAFMENGHRVGNLLVNGKEQGTRQLFQSGKAFFVKTPKGLEIFPFSQLNLLFPKPCQVVCQSEEKNFNSHQKSKVSFLVYTLRGVLWLKQLHFRRRKRTERN